MNPIGATICQNLESDLHRLMLFKNIPSEMEGLSMEELAFDLDKERARWSKEDQESTARAIVEIIKKKFPRSKLLHPANHGILFDAIRDNENISPYLRHLFHTQAVNPVMEPILQRIETEGLAGFVSLEDEIFKMMRSIGQRDIDSFHDSIGGVTLADRQALNGAIKNYILKNYNPHLVENARFQRELEHSLRTKRFSGRWKEMLEVTKNMELDADLIDRMLDILEYEERMLSSDEILKLNVQYRALPKLRSAMRSR